MYISGNQTWIQEDLRARRGDWQWTRLRVLWVGALKGEQLSQIHRYLLGKSKPRWRKYLNSSNVRLLLTGTLGRRRDF